MKLGPYSRDLSNIPKRDLERRCDRVASQRATTTQKKLRTTYSPHRQREKDLEKGLEACNIIQKNSLGSLKRPNATRIGILETLKPVSDSIVEAFQLHSQCNHPLQTASYIESQPLTGK